MDILVQQLINGVVLGSMYALVALGYTMVYGVLNLINFAHGEVLMIGAMTGWTLLQLLQQHAPQMPGLLQLAIAVAGETTESIGAANTGISSWKASMPHETETSFGSRVRRLGTTAMSSKL